MEAVRDPHKYDWLPPDPPLTRVQVVYSLLLGIVLAGVTGIVGILVAGWWFG